MDIESGSCCIIPCNSHGQGLKYGLQTTLCTLACMLLVVNIEEMVVVVGGVS